MIYYDDGELIEMGINIKKLNEYEKQLEKLIRQMKKAGLYIFGGSGTSIRVSSDICNRFDGVARDVIGFIDGGDGGD